MAGFEPAYGGTKNRCLTAWLHPNDAPNITDLSPQMQVLLQTPHIIHEAPRGMEYERYNIGCTVPHTLQQENISSNLMVGNNKAWDH